MVDESRSVERRSLFGIEPLTPAYGRDYTSKKALLADFDKDKDFLMPSGVPINKAQLVQMGVKRIRVRYAKLRKTDVIEVK